MESAWSEHKEVNFLRPWTWRSISEFYKIQNGGTMLKNSSDFLFTPEMWKSYIKNVSVSIECYLWVFMTSLIANSYLNLQVQHGGSKMADQIFKNNGKISTKCSLTGFWGRWLWIYRQIYKIQYGGSKMVDEIFKNNGKISTKCLPTGFWDRWL